MKEQYQELNPPYRAETVDVWLEKMQDPNGEAFRRLFDDYEELFRQAPGSRGAHHFWRGGWLDHMQQMLDKYFHDYLWLQDRAWQVWLPQSERFAYQDGVEVILAHDLEKPFRYARYTDVEVNPEFSNQIQSKASRKQFRQDLLAEYEIELNPEQQNAMQFIEGVRDEDYVPGERVDHPLAALVHGCDNLSARFGYNAHGPHYGGEIE